MNIEKIIPFSWNAWDLQDVLQHTYYDVEFLENFGIFEMGEKHICINVNYGKGIVEAYNQNGDLIKTVEFKAIPI
jgi:hypothetical protein